MVEFIQHGPFFFVLITRVGSSHISWTFAFFVVGERFVRTTGLKDGQPRNLLPKLLFLTRFFFKKKRLGKGIFFGGFILLIKQVIWVISWKCGNHNTDLKARKKVAAK